MKKDGKLDSTIHSSVILQEKLKHIEAAKKEIIAHIEKALAEIHADLNSPTPEKLVGLYSLIIEELEYFRSTVEDLEISTEYARKLSEIVIPGITSIQTFFQLCKENKSSPDWKKGQ